MTEPRPEEALKVPWTVARKTHQFLRHKGRSSHEGVVLWVGSSAPNRIRRAVVPFQHTGPGRFEVPLTERQQLARELSQRSDVILVQVHSHPADAFHSAVDEREAIPRRAGALSLVVPRFGSARRLLEDVALFELESNGEWKQTSVECLHIARFDPLQWLRDALKS